MKGAFVLVLLAVMALSLSTQVYADITQNQSYFYEVVDGEGWGRNAGPAFTGLAGVHLGNVYPAFTQPCNYYPGQSGYWILMDENTTVLKTVATTFYTVADLNYTLPYTGQYYLVISKTTSPTDSSASASCFNRYHNYSFSIVQQGGRFINYTGAYLAGYGVIGQGIANVNAIEATGLSPALDVSFVFNATNATSGAPISSFCVRSARYNETFGLGSDTYFPETCTGSGSIAHSTWSGVRTGDSSFIFSAAGYENTTVRIRFNSSVASVTANMTNAIVLGPGDGCRVIDVPGVYYQTSNIIDNKHWPYGSPGCIQINGTNITYDAQGYWINSSYTESGHKFDISLASNVVVKNLKIYAPAGNPAGTVNCYASQNVTVRDSYIRTAPSIQDYPVFGRSCANTTYVNNTIIGAYVGLVWRNEPTTFYRNNITGSIQSEDSWTNVTENIIGNGVQIYNNGFTTCTALESAANPSIVDRNVISTPGQYGFMTSQRFCPLNNIRVTNNNFTLGNWNLFLWQGVVDFHDNRVVAYGPPGNTALFWYYTGSPGTKIYNNFFNTSTPLLVTHVNQYGIQNVVFNVTKAAGAPIYGGGVLIGGNYWASYYSPGSGFSENVTACQPGSDGFCTNAFLIQNDTTTSTFAYDYLPLTAGECVADCGELFTGGEEGSGLLKSFSVIQPEELAPSNIVTQEINGEESSSIISASGVYNYNQHSPYREVPFDNATDQSTVLAVDVASSTYSSFATVSQSLFLTWISEVPENAITTSANLSVQALKCSYDVASESIIATMVGVAAPKKDWVTFQAKYTIYPSGTKGADVESTSLERKLSAPETGEYTVVVTAKDTYTPAQLDMTCKVNVQLEEEFVPDNNCMLGEDNIDGSFNYPDSIVNHNWLLNPGSVAATVDSRYLAFGASQTGNSMIFHPLACDDQSVRMEARLRTPQSSADLGVVKLQLMARSTTSKSSSIVPIAMATVTKTDIAPYIIVTAEGSSNQTQVFAANSTESVWLIIGVSANRGSGLMTIDVTREYANGTRELGRSVEVPLTNNVPGQFAGVQIIGINSLYMDYVSIVNQSGIIIPLLSQTTLAKRFAAKKYLTFCKGNPGENYDPDKRLSYTNVNNYCNVISNLAEHLDAPGYCNFKDLQEVVMARSTCYSEAYAYCVNVTYPKTAGFSDSGVAELLKLSDVKPLEIQQTGADGATVCAAALGVSVVAQKQAIPFMNVMWGLLSDYWLIIVIVVVVILIFGKLGPKR